MSITPDGFFDWMERVPYPPHKVNGGRNPLLGMAAHSAEGWEGYLRGYAADQTRQASWHWSNLRTVGRPPMQHYPVFAQTWTSGARWPNSNLVSSEAEGVAGQPLNDWQTENVVRALSDLREFTGRSKIERIGDRTTAPPDTLIIMEHKEATRFGAAATSCPSQRYDWQKILQRLEPVPEPPKEEEDGMIRWGGIANDGFFRGRRIEQGKLQPLWARYDYHLPREAKSVDLCIYLRDGVIEVLDGNGDKAGFAMAGGSPSHWRVFMNDTDVGEIVLRGYTDAVVDQIECLGYWR